jgi:hypothetical protein
VIGGLVSGAAEPEAVDAEASVDSAAIFSATFAATDSGKTATREPIACVTRVIRFSWICVAAISSLFAESGPWTTT